MAEEQGGKVRREAGIQGQRWQSMHQGYFSHSAIADPLVEVAAEVIAKDAPDVVADLGGGTGVVLRQLLQRRGDRPVRLVNVDLSARQLAECRDSGIEVLNASALQVRREDLRLAGGRLMFLMRSLLHYFGREGLRPALSHLRKEMIPGELFLHQTVCFAEERDADCANRLYQTMRTGKWFPTTDGLSVALRSTGWEVCEVRYAPPLALESAELMERYQLTPHDVAAIRDDLVKRFGAAPGVLLPRPDGFIAWLHYAIFICRAT